MKLDKHDIEILKALQKNARASVRVISRKVRLPITTTHARIRRLERQGYIRSYTAVLNEEALGRALTAYVWVKVRYNKETQRDIANKIAAFGEVQEVAITTGEWDLLLKVKVANVKELDAFVVDKLRTVKGVDKTLTNVVLNKIKETTELRI